MKKVQYILILMIIQKDKIDVKDMIKTIFIQLC